MRQSTGRAVFVVLGLVLATVVVGISPAGAAAVSPWKIKTTANPGKAQGSYLEAVSCTAPTACTAVGYSFDSYGNRVTLAERWNGTAWKAQTTHQPAGSLDAILQGVSCKSPTLCIAVGNSTSATRHTVLAERWNGSTWSIQAVPSPASATYPRLTSVSCTSVTACTAVGFAGNNVLAEIWNGSTWRIQSIPTPTTGALSAVSCVSTTCAAVGYSSTLNESFSEVRTAGVWKIQPIPLPTTLGASDLYGVSCTSATACTAVGNFLNTSYIRTTLVERWNGSVWKVQPSPSVTTSLESKLTSVSCSAANACTAVGFTTTGYAPLAEVWNGSVWRIQPTAKLVDAGIAYFPGGDPQLNGVSCSSAARCTTVGSYLNHLGWFATLAEVK